MDVSGWCEIHGTTLGKPGENGDLMGFYGIYPPVIKHGLQENGPFIGDFQIKTSIHRGFSVAMFDYQRDQRVRIPLLGSETISH